ncbi:predicted protein [Naegleria gruberi]|uniref:Predicted protein n=1 Tax=Naegleria gruberi TaxID=5762 RepID=D2V5E5_NAEGR|nr:uncharacterized protein NAEGRDRAFT_63794 [Naegleria gruberi]EFC48099.1 predicted protein [Naegleria gruberi]|eukprot:XP_002680843.1 predicted protein [Naegleria gruberi strain NEG-M]
MLFYCTIEQFVTIFLPVLYSVRYDSKNSEEISMEVAIKLKEGDAYAEILDIARRGYHPEQMLAWYDIELFKTGKLPITKETALQIISLYLERDSPLNINIPKHFDIPNLLGIANHSPIIPRDMFDGIQSFCFNDICKCLCGHNSARFELNEKKLDIGLWNDY